MRDFKLLRGEPEMTHAREAYNRVLERRNQEQQDEWWDEPDIIEYMEQDTTSSNNRIEVLQQRITMLQNVLRGYEVELRILTE